MNLIKALQLLIMALESQYGVFSSQVQLYSRNLHL